MENYGLILVEPTAQDYRDKGKLSLGGAPLQMSGQWDAYLPEKELQAQYVETQACVSFGTLNCVEALEKKIYGAHTNWSDRFLANISGTTQYGNDPNTVAEVLRKKGTVYQEDWPFTADINTWAKFYSTIPFDTEVQAQAKFRAKYNFGHQWVGTDPQSMKNALQYSPLGVAVQAWPSPGNDGIYEREGGSNHWVCCYGYVNGRYWKIFDTYDNTKKKLAWDYGFPMVKQYTLDKQVLNNSLWSIAVRWIRAQMGLPYV